MTPTVRAVIVLVTPLLAAACGTTTVADKATTTGAGGHATTTSAGGGSTTSPPAPGCPAADPGDGAPCDKEGLICEFGTDYDPRCNTVRACTSGHFAEQTAGYAGTPSCPSSPPSVPPNPASCPATSADVPLAHACKASGDCNYDDAKCFCGAWCNGLPNQDPPCDVDAGVVDQCCSDDAVWHCFRQPKLCPKERPRVGTACDPGAACSLMEPDDCNYLGMKCDGGVWQVEASTCPISTRRAKDEIAYLDDAARARLRDEVARVKLATYRYKQGDPARHLGFVIEDMPPGSPAVLPSRDRVDLYGYVSMAVAALQEHERELAALRAEVARLSAENAALRAKGGKR